jgi:hypothetical protein
MDTEQAEANDQRVIDTNEVPHRYCIHFRCGVSALVDIDIIDRLREDLASEITLAVEKVINKRSDDMETFVYDGINIECAFKISSEIDWIQL